MLKVRDDYFKGPESMFAPVDLSELLEEMDEQGVRKAILMDILAKPSITARKFVEAKPDRFALAMGGVNLLRPMPSLRELSAVVATCRSRMPLWDRAFGVTASIRPVTPSTIRSTPSAPSSSCRSASTPASRDRRSPVRCSTRSTSTGCACGFPNCKLCMIHGADPWWDVAIRLLIKYANLRLMTSAWSPKRLPESLLHYMRTRGPNKVIFASDWPVLRMRRVVPEACALDLPAEVLDNYLYNNAQEFFFGQEH